MTTEHHSTSATFSELLRRWRRKRGLSQRSFGELLKPQVQRSTVSCWETNVCRPSLRFLGQIVALTGIPAQVALGIDDIRQERQS